MKNLILIILLGYCNFLFSQSIEKNDSIRQLIKSYQYKDAIDLINKQLQSNGSEATLYQLKGVAYKGLIKYPEAIYAFENAIAKDSSNFQTYTELGFCYKLLGNYPKAINAFAKANSLNSDNISIKMEIAGILVSSEEYNKALSIYLSLYVKDTTNVFLIRSIGKAYENLEMTDSAGFYYEKAVQLNPFDAQSVIRLSNIYLKLSKYSQAVFVTENYKRHDRINLKINRLNAYAYYLSDNYKIAIKHFKACIEANDTTDFTFKYLGLSYFRTEINDSAKMFLEKAFLKDSLNAQTCYALGIACTKSKFKKEGVLYLNKTLDLITPSPKFESEVLQNLADAYNKCNQYQSSLRSLLSANRVTPDDTLLKFRIAAQYDDNLKNKKQALKYYNEFLKTKPARKNSGQNRPALTLSYYDAVEKRINQLKEELPDKTEASKPK